MSNQKNRLLVDLGQRIRELRTARGWTQTDMAVYFDLNRGHISDIETGKREVGLITLQVIAWGFKTKMSTLLEDL